MKIYLRVVIGMLVLLIATTSLIPPVAAASPAFVVVTWGDTLSALAARTGTTVDALVRTNGLPNRNFIYAGQKLVVPVSTSGQPPSVPLPSSRVYIVNPGETLATIAARYGTTISAMMAANSINNPNFIYSGQRLNIPGNSGPVVPASSTAPVNPPAPGGSAPAPTSGKWIDVNITAQRITAYQGSTPVKSVLVSTGVSYHPTPVGHYKIYLKVQSQTMSGGVGAEAYSLPNVPWVMYFAGDNAIHGTYWHHNFGHPMSHGCVNLPTPAAEWMFNWASVGTPVVTHW